jgi:protein-tyrosine phosphatase
MEEFIDIHSHLLPGLDDGSNSMEQTINMLKIAYEEGIRAIIATPHCKDERTLHSMSVLQESLEAVKEEIQNLLPDLSLYLGSEIYYSHESIKYLQENKIPTLADTKYILVEFSPIADYRYMKNALQELLLEGYSPVIAHIERYEVLAKKLDLVEELIEMGAYVQVNAMSIIGESGRLYQSITKKLLKNNLVHMVATDAHSDKARAPKLIKCYSHLVKKYGEEYAKELIRGNQLKLLSNQNI